MANQVTFYVTDVGLKGPFQGPKGSYDRIELTGKEENTGNTVNYTVFRSSSEDLPEQQVGDTLKITTEKNGKFDKVLKVEKITDSKPKKGFYETIPETNETSKTNYQTTTKAQSTQTGRSNSYDNKGARLGGIYHDAVKLAIHNSEGKPVDIVEITKTAVELLKSISSVENSNS